MNVEIATVSTIYVIFLILVGVFLDCKTMCLLASVIIILMLFVFFVGMFWSWVGLPR